MNFLAKRWYFAIPLMFLLSPLLIILYFMATYGYSFGEATECLKYINKASTKFRQGQYSEEKFHDVHVGDTGRVVFEHLGIPLERHDGDTKWCYSLPVGGTEYYHERTFIMENGKVTKVLCRFHTPESKD